MTPLEVCSNTVQPWVLFWGLSRHTGGTFLTTGDPTEQKDPGGQPHCRGGLLNNLPGGGGPQPHTSAVVYWSRLADTLYSVALCRDLFMYSGPAQRIALHAHAFCAAVDQARPDRVWGSMQLQDAFLLPEMASFNALELIWRWHPNFGAIDQKLSHTGLSPRMVIETESSETFCLVFCFWLR